MVHYQVVTGYIPIANHPRSAKEYLKLGERLRGLECMPQAFYTREASTWMHQMIQALPFRPTRAVADNPLKNTLAYHCVVYQKFQWLCDAMHMSPDADPLIWLDYGICHLPGVNVAVINKMLGRVKREDAIAVPGCWPTGDIRDDIPCWRFCGALMVVPRQYVQTLKNLIQCLALLHIFASKKVTWEVNTLARAEQTGQLPFRWYSADHDETMFRNY